MALIHSHDYDDEPPVRTDKNGNPYPYACRACEVETGDSYAWTKGFNEWAVNYVPPIGVMTIGEDY